LLTSELAAETYLFRVKEYANQATSKKQAQLFAISMLGLLSNFNDEGICSSKIFVYSYCTTQHYIPEDSTFIATAMRTSYPALKILFCFIFMEPSFGLSYHQIAILLSQYSGALDLINGLCSKLILSTVCIWVTDIQVMDIIKHDHRIQTINVPLKKLLINVNFFLNIKCKTTKNSAIHSEIQITCVHAPMR
jgi:hypothetical protein